MIDLECCVGCRKTFPVGTLKLMGWIHPEPHPVDPEKTLCAETVGKICDDCYVTHWAVEVK